MATDMHGNPITAEEVKGLEHFSNNNVSMKLCYEPSSVLTFEIDDTFAEENAEDADIYWSILPSQMRDILFIPSVGEELLFAKQYAGEILGAKHVIKRFLVTKVEKEICQDTTRLALHVTISVMPI